MSTSKYLFLAYIILILSACEKVVVIDLNEANQQSVIEAEISSNKDGSFVTLSKTASYYGTDDFETIQNAVVTITRGGLSRVLKNSSPLIPGS